MGSESCGSCRNGVLFTVLTLLTIGASSALFIVMVAFFVHFKLSTAESGLFAGIIAAMCVSLLLLLYGFYASLCGSRGHKFLLAVLYCIFAVLIALLGIFILALRNKISTSVGELFDKHSGSSFVTMLEEELQCSNWTGCTDPPCCKDRFDELYRSYGNPIGASLIVLFVALMVGDFFAWKWVCKNLNTDSTKEHMETTTPLTYSW
jgi:hypothetical protein